jgi:hypothetical protein
MLQFEQPRRPRAKAESAAASEANSAAATSRNLTIFHHSFSVG